MAKKSSSKINLEQATNPANLNLENEEDRLVLEIGKVIAASKQKPKAETFSFALSQIPDALLSKMLDCVGNNQDDDHPAVSTVVLLGIFLRQHLHGNKRGGFEAADRELLDIINTVTPYFTVELVRRRGCFGVVELPESPWLYNAVLHIRDPKRVAIEKTVTELKSLKVPVFPLLTDETDLQRMEKQNLGVVVEMGVRGRSVATEETLNLQPHKAPALDPKIFIDAFVDVNENADGTAPLSSATLPPSMPAEVDFIDSKGTARRINVSEMHKSTEGRMVAIFHNHFGQDFEQERSAILRFYALMKLLRDGSITKWTQETPEVSSMHPAILITAATMKLTKGGGFPPAKFQQEVQRLISEAAKT